MDIIDFVEKLKDFQKVYKREEYLLPFHFNVIDELHANENAHTRILQKILQYKYQNEYPFLLSFLENFLPDYNSTIEFPLITYNQEYIDLLIEDQKSDFACIIENKIHWAADQSEQISRYIKTIRNHGKKNIFVIYLTRDGSKQVSDVSFTTAAKKYLGYNENSTGKFIPLNYREHILPWLKDTVLNNCMYKDRKMIAGVVQYIDHLEGIFNIREDKKKMNKALLKCIQENLNINGSSPEDFVRVAECQELLNIFQTELNNLKGEMIKQNPWNLPANEKASWLAKELRDIFNNESGKASPFSKIWIWEENTLVFDHWIYNDYTFAIDISCGNLTGQGASIVLRNRCSSEQYRYICEQNFSTIFEKHGWKYQNNWRYMKSYDEITNNDKKNFFIIDIRSLLTDLRSMSQKEN